MCGPQLKKERKEREEVEIQLAASRREAGAMRAALNAARSQRDDLEAELMEAALDVMEGEKQRASLQVTISCMLVSYVPGWYKYHMSGFVLSQTSNAHYCRHSFFKHRAGGLICDKSITACIASCRLKLVGLAFL